MIRLVTDDLRPPGDPPKRHLLSVGDLTRDDVERLLGTARTFETSLERHVKKLPTLKGHLIVNLFYESSTRTSSSFELAAKRLSADTLTIKSVGSSVDKGESLKDTALTLGAYDPDVIVIRHPQIGAPQLVARVTDAHVVNAGDGKHQHPTQALLDLYTLREEFGRLEGLHVAIVGDVLHSRVARSLVQAFSLVGVRPTLVGPPALLPREFPAETTTDIEAIRDADVVYVLRMQNERMEPGANFVPSLREYTARWGITPERLRPGQKVMHPGPMNRGVEIDSRVADSPESLIVEAGPVGARRADGRSLRRAHRRAGRRAGARRGGGGVMLWQKELPGADLVIRGARVLDPTEGIDARLEVRIDGGTIAEVAEKVDANGHRVVDADGLVLAPAFVDPHVHLRTPGREDEETVASGTAAAAAGGYCAILAMPNTDPVVDSAATLGALVETARREAEVPVGFLAAITRGQRGEELTEMGELADTGAVAFSDDGVPVASAGLMRRALQYASTTDRPLALHCEEPTLSHGGHVHEGRVAAELGFAGYPSVAESVAVERDLALAAYESGRIHVLHLSAAESVDALRRARDGGRRGERRGDAAPPRPDRRRGALARPEREDEPAAARRAGPGRAARGGARRDDRGDRDRPRAARRAREGRAVRGGAVRRHRARDRVRVALHAPRPAGPAVARDAARADVRRAGADLRARPAAGRGRRAGESRPARSRAASGRSASSPSARGRTTRGCSARG